MKDTELIQAYSSAKGFIDAAVYLKSKIHQNGCNLIYYSSAMTANLAFATEIYLKQIRRKIVGERGEGHKLKTLYKRLPKNVKSEICVLYDNKCKEYNDLGTNKKEFKSIIECLETFDSAFENWRYHYEEERRNKSLTVAWDDLFILVDVLREYIENNNK